MLKLGSVIEYGFGPNTEAISLIYSNLLSQQNISVKSNILINHIGADLEEFVTTQGSLTAINIRYPIPVDFKDLSFEDKNFHFAAIIHEALCRLANSKPFLDINKLEMIYKEIVDKKYLFDITYKVWPCKKNQDLIAKIIIRPEMDKFTFLGIIEENGIEKCKVTVYRGAPTTLYFRDLFSVGKWKTDKTIIISGIKSEIEIYLSVKSCELEFKNKNGEAAAPLFELFKADADKTTTLQNYLNSLNPALAAMIVQSPN